MKAQAGRMEDQRASVSYIKTRLIIINVKCLEIVLIGIFALKF